MHLPHRLTTALLALVLLGAPVLPTAAAVAQAAVHGVPAATDPAAGATWSVTPAGADGPDGRVSYRLELEPGAEHTDHVAVTNYSEAPTTFTLLASDGIVTQDGVFDLLPSSRQPEDGGAWVEIQPDVEVAAGATAVVPFTVRVPSDATPGDHPAGVVAAVSRAGQDGAGQAVVVDSRVGARLHLRVAGDVRATAGITEVTARYTPSWNPFAPGTLDVDWTVANGGNVRLGAEQVLAVDGPGGIAAVEATEVASQREVLPGQGAQATASVPVWPLARLDASLTSRHAAVGDDVVDGVIAPATAHAQVWAIPWSQLALLVLVAGGLGLALRVRRRRRERLAAALEAARAEGARAASEPVAVSS